MYDVKLLHKIKIKKSAEKLEKTLHSLPRDQRNKATAQTVVCYAVIQQSNLCHDSLSDRVEFFFSPLTSRNKPHTPFGP